MEKRNIFISAGHSNHLCKDMGAIGIGGVKEGDLTVELRDLIVSELLMLNQEVITDINSNVTRETVKIIKVTLNSRDIAIDIHFNAFAIESARGTEVLVPFKSSYVERTLAKILVDNITACLSTKNRGVKTEATSFKQQLLFMTPNCENILIEVCFITNKADMLMYVTKKKVLAKIIARCLYDFLTK
jgi:N-acetylmuramoyl-L-alanine amidase